MWKGAGQSKRKVALPDVAKRDQFGSWVFDKDMAVRIAKDLMRRVLAKVECGAFRAKQVKGII